VRIPDKEKLSRVREQSRTSSPRNEIYSVLGHRHRVSRVIRYVSVYDDVWIDREMLERDKTREKSEHRCLALSCLFLGEFWYFKLKQ